MKSFYRIPFSLVLTSTIHHSSLEKLFYYVDNEISKLSIAIIIHRQYPPYIAQITK